MSKDSIFFGRFKRPANKENHPVSETPSRHYFTAEPSPQIEKAHSDAPNQMGVCADTDLPWLKSLWQFGRQRALARGSTRGNKEDIKALIAHAEAMAEAHTPLPWDPANNAHDAQVVRSLAQLETELEVFKCKLAEQIADYEEAEREYANINKSL